MFGLHDFRRRTESMNTSAGQQGNFIGILRGEIHIMQDGHDGMAGPGKAACFAEKFMLVQRIEARDGFVEQKNA